tara:strand:+ start:1059 stop:1958 length:900 start_codon:yes stop_codon:yes gene_type:complete
MATNPYKEAAQSMMQAGIGSLSGNTINNNMGGGPLAPLPKPWQSAEGYNLPTNVEKEFNKFQVRANEPVARDLENWVFDHRRNEGLYPMNIDSVPIPGGGWHVRDRNLRKIQPIINAGIANPNLKQLAGLDDVWPWMKDKAWPWMKETGKGMKNQIPYFLDNMVPFYEPPEGYYDPDWEENKDMAGMDDSWQYLQKQIDELNPDSPNYEDQLELLQSDMDMKYPWMQMAELTDDQINFMGHPLNTPDFGGITKEELYNKVKEMEDKGFLGFGAQEPTTIEEFNEMYERMKRGEIGNWVT